MKTLFALLIILNFGCAKKAENKDEFVQCQVMFGEGLNREETRFYDIDRGYFVNVEYCDVLIPTDTVIAL